MISINDPILIFFIVYFVNLLLDYPLQSNFEAQNKSKSYYVLFVHSAIWGLGLSILIIYLIGELHIWKILMLVFGHMIIDGWKCRNFKGPDDWNMKWKMDGKVAYWIDQTLHVIQIVVALY